MRVECAGLADESAIHRNITPHVILAPKRTKLRERKTPSSFGKRLLGLPCFMGLDLEVGSKLNPQPFLGTGASEIYYMDMHMFDHVRKWLP